MRSATHVRIWVTVAVLGIQGATGLPASASELPSTSGTVARPPDAPLFSRHIVPLFSRLGCNLGSCHGAVQGKNGFRLSLFGAEPAVDHERLLREFGGRRLNLANPDESLLLLKAVARVPHDGGKRTDPGSPEYQMLRAWIAQGAPLDPLDRSPIKRLDVTPLQQTVRPGDSYALRVTAELADGSIEDVTALCTFEAREESVAEVNRDGGVRARAPGSASLVVRYRGQPVGVTVLVPADSPGAFPEVKEHNFIDRHVLARLRQLNIHPAAPCDDSTFLRRASLDVTGALPSPDEIRTFLADTRADKRTQKIDELLQRSGHGAVWASRFCDLLKPQFGTFSPLRASHTRRFYEWLRARFQENTPYDQLVERIVLATTAEGRSQDEILEELRQLAEEDTAQTPDLKVYAQRKTLDIFWMRTDATGLPGALQFSHAFLGLRLKCAQCHRHPADVWQQEDLLSFANFFTRVGKQASGLAPAERKQRDHESKQQLAQAKKLSDQAKDKKLTPEEAGKLLDEAAELTRQAGIRDRLSFYRTDYSVGVLGKGSFAKVAGATGMYESKHFRLLGVAEPLPVRDGDDPRVALMAWLRKPDHPYFARAIVNRVWAHCFGRGIVDPPDDLSRLNPPTHPELLEELCSGFIKHGYDLRWLHRTILTSRTYQQSGQVHDGNRTDSAHYARAYPRRMSAELSVDAINHATGGSETFPVDLYLPVGAKAIEVPGTTQSGNQPASVQFAFSIFGRSGRDPSIQCDCVGTASSPTMTQGLYTAASAEVLKKIADPKGRAAQIALLPDADRRIEEVFLWTLSRLPTAGERQVAREHLAKTSSAARGVQDLLWALLNNPEFLTIR